jgi:hypothetical protein
MIPSQKYGGSKPYTRIIQNCENANVRNIQQGESPVRNAEIIWNMTAVNLVTVQVTKMV